MLKTLHNKIATSIQEINKPKCYYFNFALSVNTKGGLVNKILRPSIYKSNVLINHQISHNLCLDIIESIIDRSIFITKDHNILKFEIHIYGEDSYNEEMTFKVTNNLLPRKTKVIDIPLIIPILNTYDVTIDRFEEYPAIINFTDELSSLDSQVSNNIFIPIRNSRTDGKTYKEIAHDQMELFNKDINDSRLKTKVRKAYIRTKTTYSEHIVKKNIWDLLYPLLLPPLKYDFSEQFDLYQELYPFQKEGVNFLFNNTSALLGDQMGTGKTIQAIIALRLLFRKADIKNALVLCPLAVVGSAHLSVLTGKSEGWDGHLYNWAPELIVTVVRGNQEVREYDWQCPAHVFISTYDTLRNDIKSGLLSEEILSSFDCVILDEAQYIKNYQSGRSKAVRKLNPHWRWALTGTPIENTVNDVISIFSFIKPGLFKRSTSYDPYQVRSIIAPYFLRRLKKDVFKELPKKLRQEEWLELDGDQKTAYQNALMQGQIALKETVKTSNEFKVRRHIFTLLNTLKQICNFAPNKINSPKTEALFDLVETIKENNDKVVIFSQYRNYGIDKIEKYLDKRDIQYCTYHGGLTDAERNRVVNTFRKDPNVTVFLASVKAAGIGMTLTEASYVIHFDHWWNPAVMWQAEDRTHRPGQKKNVNVISFWMQDTIEEKIKRKLKDKGLLIENVIDSLATNKIDEMISTEEWLEMFGVQTDSNRYKSKSTKTIDEMLENIKSMTPIEFEEVSKEFFIRIGFTNAQVTQKSYDGGIDVYGSRVRDGEAETIVAQCKRTESVGVKVARELLGIIANNPNIHKGYIITSGSFTSECQNFANSTDKLVLINGLVFSKYLVDLGIV